MHKILTQGLVSILYAALILFSTSTFAAKISPIGTQEGQMAPNFQVNKLDGSSFNLADYKGKKPVYLIFWATWCPTCKEEIPGFKALHQEMGNQIEVIAVNVDSLSWWSSLTRSNSRVEHYVKKYEINYPVALDDDKKLIELYQVRGTPTQLLIDKEGIVRRRYPILNAKTISLIKSSL